MKKILLLFLVAWILAPFAARGEEGVKQTSRASLAVELGIDSLERRYYHPVFRFDFPADWGNLFAEVQYHSRLNGRLQGAIDYWVNVGVEKTVAEKLKLELRLNHFCRHETSRDTRYIWNVNEVLARAGVGDETFDLALGLGGFIGSSPGYRGLAVISGAWRGFLVPELSLLAEVKLVNFGRIYHEAGFALALHKNIDLFFKNTRHYEYPNTSYLGLRYKSAASSHGVLDAMKMLVGVTPFDAEFKLEVAGSFKFEFFANHARRVVFGVDFESPILNGDSFFSQFWPRRMVYDLNLDYERKIAPQLFIAWATHYRATMPVDMDQAFRASLFSGLALRNQANFDAYERDVRFEIAAGYNFKRGAEFLGKLGFLLWRRGEVKVVGEMQNWLDRYRMRIDMRLAADFGLDVRLRPYIGWRKYIQFDPAAANDGRILIGFGFFKSF